MGKYSDQFKRAAILAYLEGTNGYRKVAQHFSMDVSLLRRWVAYYQIHGELSPRGRGLPHSKAFKHSVLEIMRKERLSHRQVAARFGLGQSSQIGIWARQYYSGDLETLVVSRKRSPAPMPKKPAVSLETLPPDDDSRTREQLLAELEYLRMENAYLKKLEEVMAETDRRSPSGKKRKP